MDFLINFTTSSDDVERYTSADDLKQFYESYGCSGLELMPLDGISHPLVRPEMVKGVHLRCIDDWMGKDKVKNIEHYRKDLDAAASVGAEYVVFHVSQVSLAEALGEPICHTDEEVIDAACDLINALLDGQDYSFWFLMENMWYPGLTFLRTEMTQRLLDGIHYAKKGFVLDTGHLMHTNLDLETQEEAADYILEILEQNTNFLPFIKGIHLQQSLTGKYVKEYMANRPPIETYPARLFTQAFMHIFQMDLHLPFTTEKACQIVERIQPLYVTYEYITDSREKHANYLEQGVRALAGLQKNEHYFLSKK